MDEIECKVTWKGKNAKITLRLEDEEVKGYVNGKTHALTLELNDDDEIEETFCHDDLEYEDELLEQVAEALDAEESDEDSDEDEDEDEDDDEDEEDDEDEDDEESDDDEDSDDEDEDSDEEESDDEDDEVEVDEDADADYGTAVKPAQIDGAPTMHVLMVAYGAGIDVDGDIRIMRNLFNVLQESKVVSVREQLLTGAAASGQGTLDAIAQIDPGPDDILWFFYSGHGCMEEGDRLLCTHGKMIRRAAIVDALAKKNARFNVVLSDCCAVEAGRLSPAEKMGSAPSAPSAERLNKLFRSFKGFFDVSSSSDFQYSFGGVFTPALVDKVILKGKAENWAEVFEKTQSLAMADSDGALPADAKKKLKKEGKKVEDHQKPVAFKLPDPS